LDVDVGCVVKGMNFVDICDVGDFVEFVECYVVDLIVMSLCFVYENNILGMMNVFVVCGREGNLVCKLVFKFSVYFYGVE